MSMKHTPKVVDNDRDEISVTLDGKEIRGWSYTDEAERRVKITAAREYCEGWYQAMQQPMQTAAADMFEALEGAEEAILGWKQRLSQRDIQMLSEDEQAIIVTTLDGIKSVLAKARGEQP